MAILPPDDQEIPQHVTVTGYSLVGRLGVVQTISATFAETVDDNVRGAVVEARDDDGDGNYETLVIPEFFQVTEGVVGRPLVAVDGQVLGTVAEVLPDSSTLRLSEGLLEPPVIGLRVKVHRANHFGIPVNRQAKLGRAWELSLNSSDPEQRARMVQILGGVTVRLAGAVLAEAGAEATSVEGLLAATQRLAEQGHNLDGFIVQELERLELDRRAGRFNAVQVSGTAPVA